MQENWRDEFTDPADLGCGFNERWFESDDPDAICVEGYLQDINFHRPNWDCRLHPCPRCNTYEYLCFEYEECSRTLHASKVAKGHERPLPHVHKSWATTKQYALRQNPEEAAKAITDLGELS